MGHLVASRGLMEGPGHPVRLTLARTQPVRRAARVMRGHREDGIVTVPAIGRLAAGLTMLVVSSLMTVLAPTPAPAAAATPALLVPVSAGEQTRAGTSSSSVLAAQVSPARRSGGWEARSCQR